MVPFLLSLAQPAAGGWGCASVSEQIPVRAGLHKNCLYLSLQMKKLLKYLLLVIVAAAFFSGTEGSVSVDTTEQCPDIFLYDEAFELSLSAPESELAVPRQVFFAHTHQVQSSARRTVNSHRNNLEFTKAGKLINAGIQYFVQNLTIVKGSSLSDPAQRLLCLGKLII